MLARRAYDIMRRSGEGGGIARGTSDAACISEGDKGPFSSGLTKTRRLAVRSKLATGETRGGIHAEELISHGESTRLCFQKQPETSRRPCDYGKKENTEDCATLSPTGDKAFRCWQNQAKG